MESDLKDLELFDIYWKDYNEVESIILSLNSMIQFDDAEQLSEKIRFMLPKFEEVGSIPNENDLRLSIRNYLFKNGDDDLSSKVFQKEITLFTVEIKKLLKMIKRCFEDISDKLKTDDLVLEKYNNNGKINLFYVCKDDPNVNSISDNFDYYVELWGRLFMKHTTVCTYLASFFIGSWSFYNLLLEVCEPYLFNTSNPKSISIVSELNSNHLIWIAEFNKEFENSKTITQKKALTNVANKSTLFKNGLKIDTKKNQIRKVLIDNGLWKKKDVNVTSK